MSRKKPLKRTGFKAETSELIAYDLETTPIEWEGTPAVTYITAWDKNGLVLSCEIEGIADLADILDEYL